jgi:hypothetical protein
MSPIRLLVPALLRASLTLAAGLALVLGAAIQPAAATSSVPPPVALGTHRFGHLRPPDVIVARAGPDEVGFSSPPEGADGVSYGPWSFDVAQDGSVWLLDQVNHQLLVWQPGQPNRPPRAVRLPLDPLERIANFAVAPDHTIYATYVPPPGPGPGPKTLRLAALAPSGQVRWTAATTDQIFNAQLRIGPDGTLYVVGGLEQAGTHDHWTPLTTPAGRPLPLAEQRRRTSPHPLPAGLRMAATRQAAGDEWRFALTNQAGRILHGWRVTSQTDLGALAATPAMVGGDPVVVIEVSQQTKTKFLYEYEVLRLARAGGTSVRFAIAPESRVVYGEAPMTGLRVGPDGQLYQLRSSRIAGVSIARYSLTPGPQAPPTTAPVPPPPPPTGPPIDNGGMTTPTVTLPTTQPTPPAVNPAATHSPVRPWLPGLAGLTAITLTGLAMWLLSRRRHRAPHDPQTRSRMATDRKSPTSGGPRPPLVGREAPSSRPSSCPKSTSHNLPSHR